MVDDESAHLLGTRTPTRDQIVLHLDVDCFFAACERLRDPDLRGEPVVVGGGFDADPPRGAVATASYEAREYGVHSAQPMAAALERLPRRATTEAADDEDVPTGIYLEGDHAYYREISEAVVAIVSDRAGTVRRLGMDEAYLDATGETTWDDASSFAAGLKADIEAETGVVASAGVAPTMSCAKIASDHDKPDGLRVVLPGEVRSFLAPLPVEAIHGVGPVGAETFRSAGVETAGDLAALSPQEVADRFGSRAATLYDRVRGVDPRTVEPVGRPKSLSKERSVEPTDAMETKRALVRTLATKVSDRTASTDARYRTIGIKVVTTPFDVNTRERTLHGPIREPDLVEEVALDLLEEFRDESVRKLGVRVSNLEFFAGEQVRLDDWEPPEQSPSGGDSTPRRLGRTRLTDFT